MTRQNPAQRWFKRSISAAAATALFCLSTVTPVVFAQNQPDAGEQPNAATLSQWANTDVRPPASERPLALSIKEFDSAAVPADGTANVTVTLKNTSEQAIEQIIVRSEATDRLTDPEEARTTLIDTSSRYRHTTSFAPVVDKLEANETRDIMLQIPVGAAGPTGLGLSEPGVYGLAINANGQVGAESQETFLADARTFLTIAPTKADAANNADGSAGLDQQKPAMFSMLWPLAADINIVTGETGTAPSQPELILKDESLADEFADGGRLQELVASMANASQEVRDATCLAVDPALAVTASRMAKGYVTATERPSPVPQTVRLRDSWGADPNKVDTTPGTGAAAANQWLSDLRLLAKNMCVTALPAQTVNVDALAQLNDPSLSLTALGLGPTLLDQLLEVDSQRGLVLPASGTIQEPSSKVLPYAGFQPPARAVAGGRGLDIIDSTLEDIIKGQQPTHFDHTTVLLADNTLSTPAGKLNEATTAVGFQAALGAALAGTGTGPETASYSPTVSRSVLTDDSTVARMNNAVGVLRLTADATADRPIIAMPPVQWTADRRDLTTWLEAVDQLVRDKKVRSTALPKLLVDETKASPATSILSTENDPNPVAPGLISRAGRVARGQTKLSSIMVNTNDIALTRTGFVAPLRLDILAALSDRGRRVYVKHSAATESSTSRVQDSELLLQQMEASVRLLPPGSVYTRASQSTPLMIVASNGLPLPVRGQLQVSAPGTPNIAVDTPQLVPARGSIPLPLPASEVPNADSGDFTVTLVTPGKVPISAPVTMTTRSASELLWLVVVIVVLLVAMAWGLARNITRARQKR